jgi:hypothetical protein
MGGAVSGGGYRGGAAQQRQLGAAMDVASTRKRKRDQVNRKQRALVFYFVSMTRGREVASAWPR